MLEIHQFWVDLFPIFQNSYEFVYVFFDIATIIFFFDIILYLPKMLLLGSRRI